MAGTPAKTLGMRKQWKIFTGPHSASRRNRSGLAEDGCPDSQVVLAKQLLEETCDDEVDRDENDRLGVYWLIKASEQGHVEATNMLKNCLETGRGITDLNVGDVKTCLDMPQAEKVSRHAVRQLFANLSQGEDFITSDQLYEEIERTQKSTDREIRNSIEDVQPGTSKDTDWVSRVCVSSPEKLTEDMLVTAASHHSRGELPIVHKVMTINRSKSHKTFLQASLLTPLNTVRSSYQNVIDSIGRRPIRSFLPINAACLQTLAILAIYSLWGFDRIIEAIPSFMFYATLAVMLITTCQILAKKWEFDDLKQWSNLLVAWGGPGVNAEQAQWAHCTNNIYPCFVFLFSLIANILLTPFVSQYSIPYSELTVVSVISALLILYNFSSYKGKLDYLAVVSFCVGMLARYPYETDDVVFSTWRFVDVRIPTFASYVVGNSIEFCLNFKVIFFLMMPGLLIKMASRDRWKGIYVSLVPHLISLSWWQMAVIMSNGATRFGLIRSGLAVLVVIMFVPLAGLTVVLLPMIAVFRFFLATETVLPVSVTLAIACFCLVLLLYLSTRPSRAGRVIGWFQIVLAICAAGLLIWPHVETLPHDWYSDTVGLTRNQYDDFCLHDRADRMRSPAQEKCLTLSGLYVQWEGVVESTAVSAVHNPLSSIVSKLPVKIKRVVSCMYGEKYDNCLDDHCSSDSFMGSECHLSNWNRYEYAIDISMAEGAWSRDNAKVILRADNMFRNFTTSLLKNDKIWFAGALELDPRDLQTPRIRLYQAGCLSCAGPRPPPVTACRLAMPSSLQEIYSAVRNLLNFVFNPAVNFNNTDGNANFMVS
ncbi:Wolfram syndrome 1 [Nesidiocoris tenuis]|uniref:Wolfram syndrome 1 n=1 Tax=Nesidiocoris tenuis TaxID=355587 RepID=A0ABN7AW09_9HEMI|nr:Wolfram syndrome 1 [Nesidiocoris tenuis]